MRIHVVGAGPAGSIAAISALRNGHDVTVTEDHPAPGIPENCSGLFSTDGLESLSDFIDYRKVVKNRIHGADIYLADQKLKIRRDGTVGLVCDRSALDRQLAERAEQEGAKMRYSERTTSKFKSWDVIGADGPFSTTARHFSLPRIRKFAATLQATLPYKAADPHSVEVFLSNRFFPGFFGWVIPQDEENAEFGAGVLAPARPQEAWRHLLKLKGVPYAKPRGWTIPLETRRRTAIRKGRYRVLLVGDAAGQVKATTGGGVIFGGNCAAIAGRLAGEPELYELEWRLKFGPDLALHNMIHDYLSAQSEEGISALGRRLNQFQCDDFLSQCGHMDKPTKMIRPRLVVHFLKNFAGVS